MNPRLKVLVSAYACSPDDGSEPGVGWGFVRELSLHHDLWVIVEEEKFRAKIEKFLLDHPTELQNVTFHFVRKRRNRALRKLWPASYYWYYRGWHKDVLHLARHLHSAVNFDLVHQLTMVGFREPGYLWRLGVPFVWGPIGGMGIFPWRFLHKVGIYGALYYLAYNTYNMAQMRWMRRPQAAARAATRGLIAATPENQQAVRRFWAADSLVVPEVGLPPQKASNISMRGPGEPLRILWIGAHTPGKALNLGIEAIASLPGLASIELHVFGKGRMTNAWKRTAERQGVSDRCHFHGWHPRHTVLEQMRAAHVMLVTSLRDLTSSVTIEAMASGLPIVCLDHCGFSYAVTDECGIKIPVTTPKKTVLGIADALARLNADENFRQALARGALVRSDDFSWARKADVMRNVYQQKLRAPPAEKAL